MALERFENSNSFLERAQRASRKIASLGIGSFPAQVIHRENKLRVLLYQAPERPVSRIPILMIPSLINRHYILDLLPGKSLVEFLTKSGFQVALVDWGAPGDEDRDIPFDRYIDDYLRRAIQATCQATGAPQATLLGYCLGGTMALVQAALNPQLVAGLILLTAPVHFHNSGMLSAWCRTPNYDVESLIRAHGNVPWTLMQSTFQWLRPTLSATRTMGLYKRLGDDEFVDGFYALETWANDNVSFPGRCYRDFIQKFYRENALVKNTLRVYGRHVDFSRVRLPVLNVAAAGDHIVPADATAPLRSIIPTNDFTDVVTPGGHIGAVVSRRASSGLWPQMSAWLAERFASEVSDEINDEISVDEIAANQIATDGFMAGEITTGEMTTEESATATKASTAKSRQKKRQAPRRISLNEPGATRPKDSATGDSTLRAGLLQRSGPKVAIVKA